METAPVQAWHRGDIELFLLDESHVGNAYVGWLNDARVNRFLESRFRTHTVNSTREFVRSCRSSDSTLLLGIRSRALNDRHVGNIKLGSIDSHHGLGEIGVLVGETDAWGRGIASGAISIMCDIALEQFRLRKITAGCYASNVGSERAFVRAGFGIECRRRAHYILEGRPEDLLLMAKWIQ